MLRMRRYVLCAALVALAAALARAAEQESKLIDILQSNKPPQDKAIPCKQLAVYGTKAAVPALAALLPDEKLASWARIALEAIPDPAADDALREAAGKLQGRLLIGVINSIGVRRDAKAVEALIQKLKDPDADVASAAAAALGRIGGDRAAKALEQSVAGAPAGVRSAVAEGCILCAERFLNEGKADEAVKLYDMIRKADVPKQRVLEGTRGAILARKSAGIPLLVEALKSQDKAMFGIGLRVARELPGGDTTDALVAELGRLTPERQTMLIIALADRGDPKALPAILEAIKNGPKAASLAAMGVMERIGNASCVPVLLMVALDTDEELAIVARGALAKLPGQEVDADIAGRLAQATGKTRQVLLEAVSQRRIETALPALVSCAEDADAGVRAAALSAIAALGGEKQVGDLVRILQKTQDANERAGVEKALTATTARGGAACVPQLTPLTKSGDSAVRVIGLHALACAGGPQALAAVKAALNDKDEPVQDEAVRTLSSWPNRWPDDAGVTEPLLALAKSPKTQHQVLALRGYLQYLQGNKKLNDDERLAKVNEILPLVTRPEEKKLVCSVLGTIGSARALEMLVTYAAEPATAEEACSAIVALAERKDLKDVAGELRQNALQTVLEKAKSRDTKKKAQDLLKAFPRGTQKATAPAAAPGKPGKLKIVKAVYGGLPDGPKDDVTAKVQGMVAGDTLSVDATNDNFGDPAGGVVKKLRVEYEFEGVKKSKEAGENETLTISNKGE
ncbi:MAG: HEAT repeat domain-containing protein [Planctomycetota bacterium]|nr:HEAT repeat domain-containing protein [Planctomycetota bacterium]